MRRLFLILVGVLALLLAGRALRRALASDETRIRWRVDEMCEGFAATRMAPIMDGLAPEFFEEREGVDREMVKLALAQLFLEQRGGEGGFPYRVEWSSDGPAIEPGDGESAVAARAEMPLELVFWRRDGDQEKRVWVANVTSRLEKRDGEWRFVRATTATVEGRRIR